MSFFTFTIHFHFICPYSVSVILSQQACTPRTCRPLRVSASRPRSAPAKPCLPSRGKRLDLRTGPRCVSAHFSYGFLLHSAYMIVIRAGISFENTGVQPFADRNSRYSFDDYLCSKRTPASFRIPDQMRLPSVPLCSTKFGAISIPPGFSTRSISESALWVGYDM